MKKLAYNLLFLLAQVIFVGSLFAEIWLIDRMYFCRSGSDMHVVVAPGPDARGRTMRSFSWHDFQKEYIEKNNIQPELHAKLIELAIGFMAKNMQQQCLVFDVGGFPADRDSFLIRGVAERTVVPLADVPDSVKANLPRFFFVDQAALPAVSSADSSTQGRQHVRALRNRFRKGGRRRRSRRFYM